MKLFGIESEPSSVTPKREKKRPVKKQTKKFEEFEPTFPGQLELFELVDSKDRNYSQSIELYDFMPKYVWKTPERVEGVYLPRIEREFECRGRAYNLTIFPASIVDEKTKKEKYYYLGEKEEAVEDALRKLAVEGKGVFLDNEAAMRFNINELRNELAKTGHKYSSNQILEALTILKRTEFELVSGDMKLLFSPVETLGLKGRDGETQTFVRFSPLVTKSIKEQTFRIYDYLTVMRYKNAIARQLHKRMAHHYTQASIINSYDILLSTMIRDFGLTEPKRLLFKFREVEAALKTMIKKEVILSYKIEKINAPAGQKKLLDVKFSITPHPYFAGDAKKANYFEKERKLLKQ